MNETLFCEVGPFTFLGEGGGLSDKLDFWKYFHLHLTSGGQLRNLKLIKY